MIAVGWPFRMSHADAAALRDHPEGWDQIDYAEGDYNQGAGRNRTGVNGFAGRCVATPPRRQNPNPSEAK